MVSSQGRAVWHEDGGLWERMHGGGGGAKVGSSCVKEPGLGLGPSRGFLVRACHVPAV